jgi:histidyl-tRNA synthetase
VYLCWQGADTYVPALRIAEELRSAGVEVIVHSGSAKFANQMKRADASGADYAVIVGEEEVASGLLTLKPLREGMTDYGTQLKKTAAEIISYLQAPTQQN